MGEYHLGPVMNPLTGEVENRWHWPAECGRVCGFYQPDPQRHDDLPPSDGPAGPSESLGMMIERSLRQNQAEEYERHGLGRMRFDDGPLRSSPTAAPVSIGDSFSLRSYGPRVAPSTLREQEKASKEPDTIWGEIWKLVADNFTVLLIVGIVLLVVIFRAISDNHPSLWPTIRAQLTVPKMFFAFFALLFGRVLFKPLFR